MKSVFEYLTAATALLLLAFRYVTAADPPRELSPTPEHQKLGYFVGRWSSEGRVNPSEFGPGGRISLTGNCEWFDGKFSVVCRSEGTSLRGPVRSLGILSYSREEKVYTYYTVDSSGATMLAIPRGTLQDDTWSFNDESRIDGKTLKSRITIRQLTPTSYIFAMDVQTRDGNWIRMMQSTSTRMK